MLYLYISPCECISCLTYMINELFVVCTKKWQFSLIMFCFNECMQPYLCTRQYTVPGQMVSLIQSRYDTLPYVYNSKYINFTIVPTLSNKQVCPFSPVDIFYTSVICNKDQSRQTNYDIINPYNTGKKTESVPLSILATMYNNIEQLNIKISLISLQNILRIHEHDEMSQNFVLNIRSNSVFCSHVAAILTFGGHIDFQVEVPIKNER